MLLEPDWLEYDLKYFPCFRNHPVPIGVVDLACRPASLAAGTDVLTQAMAIICKHQMGAWQYVIDVPFHPQNWIWRSGLSVCAFLLRNITWLRAVMRCWYPPLPCAPISCAAWRALIYSAQGYFGNLGGGEGYRYHGRRLFFYREQHWKNNENHRKSSKSFGKQWKSKKNWEY